MLLTNFLKNYLKQQNHSRNTKNKEFDNETLVKCRTFCPILGKMPHFWFLALNSNPIFGLIGGITYSMDAPLTCNRSLWKRSAVVHLQICQNCKPLFPMVSTAFRAGFGNTIEHVYVHIYDYYMVSKTSELKRYREYKMGKKV